MVTLDPGNLQFCVENLKEKSDLYFRIYAENSVGLSTPAGTSVISLETHASKSHTVAAISNNCVFGNFKTVSSVYSTKHYINYINMVFIA